MTLLRKEFTENIPPAHEICSNNTRPAPPRQNMNRTLVRPPNTPSTALFQLLSHPLGILVPMQETLLFTEESTADFRIDERTKRIGRQGIAAARARLAALVTTDENTHSHAA
jgi:hypothetical protein